MMRAALAAAISGALLTAAMTGAAVPHPILSLSRASGPAGTRVVVIGRDCTKPFAQRDTLAWHDRYYWLHDRGKRPPMGVSRSIPVIRTSATTVHAIFTVKRTDHLGRGLLDLFCGSGGNAITTFVVTH